MNSNNRFVGKVALVTGGNSGIGLATAKRFVSEGAYVFITGRRQKELDTAVKEIGKNVTAVQGDVSKLADLDRLFAQIKKKKGKPTSSSQMPASPSMRPSEKSLSNPMTRSSTST
jgi:NAD(P)-dependent dehydrogenase (short-subunit alcohol dehydrogenase family)